MVSLKYINIKEVQLMTIRGIKILISCLILISLAACNKEDRLFDKLDLDKAGIDFENQLTSKEDFNIIDYIYFYNGGGVSAGDINNDGLVDLFFTANQSSNKLYINKGDLEFEDMTVQAGVAGNSSWNTGSSMADINGDGLLDIYVCSVVGIKGMSGHNELYINNGDLTFTEKSKEYGLDFDTYSSSTAFFDYDNDGDLDMYLLNHAVHTQKSFGKANLREKRSYETGDRLLRNDGGRFIDVSEEANIYGGVNGYGLGISISDFNQDGYLDIFIGNDFHEDDYYYLNNGDGTFTEKGKKVFTQMSRFSMGNDAADINNDGLTDLISLDMLPKDEVVEKTSEGDESINTLKLRVDEYNYHYQFARNMLQINTEEGEFIETALYSNVAATDWSWSALFADFDMDGNQDLFISNGIPKRPNDLDYINFVSSENISPTINATKLVDQEALDLMPKGNVQNVIYKGLKGYEFDDRTSSWLPQENTCSTATALADLDNDGDLDIIINNVNDGPRIYLNKSDGKSNYLQIKFDYKKGNNFGIGTKAYCYSNGEMQYRELIVDKGFQASSEPILHFGLGKTKKVDSIKIIWPDGSYKILKDVPTQQKLIIDTENSRKKVKRTENNNGQKKLFSQVESNKLGLNFKHIEDNYTDFDRSKLIPYQSSDRGPATAIGDINQDGKEDVYFGGSKRISGRIYVKSDSGFSIKSLPVIQNDSINEDISATIVDLNNDGKKDFYIGTGGADFYGKSEPLLDYYYLSNDSSYNRKTVQGYYENASCVKPFDFDNDGDIDLFVGNQSVSNDFGNTPKSYLLENNNGVLKPMQKDLFENLGMVTDAIWEDHNSDGKIDLVVVGEWMQPLVIINEGDKFSKNTLLTSKLNGLWQTIISFDIDQDGDNDYVLGNWGHNTKFKASVDRPMKMFYNDFDGNNQAETIISIYKEDEYYPLDGFNTIASQIVSLKKKFTSYKAFAGKTIEQLFDEDVLESSMVYKVHVLASGYLRNDDGKFIFVPFNDIAQLAPVKAMLKYDFDADGKVELLMAGNYFGMQPIHGRMGSFPGVLIKSDQDIVSGVNLGLSLIGKSVRGLNIISLNNQDYLLVTLNNDEVETYKLNYSK